MLAHSAPKSRREQMQQILIIVLADEQLALVEVLEQRQPQIIGHADFVGPSFYEVLVVPELGSCRIEAADDTADGTDCVRIQATHKDHDKDQDRRS